jgi:hypothetical protein
MYPSRPVVRPDSSSILLMSYAAKHMFEPLNVDARCCDSKRSSLLLHRWVWSRQLKGISMPPNNQSTRRGLVGKGRTPSLRPFPIYTASFEPPQSLFSKERLPVGIRCHSNYLPLTVTRQASDKKEQRLVKAITLHIPRRLACGNSESRASD